MDDNESEENNVAEGVPRESARMQKSALLPNMGSVQLWLACPAATCRAIRRRLPVDPKILSHRLNVFDYGTSHVSHPTLPQVGRVSTWSNRRVEGKTSQPQSRFLEKTHPRGE